MSPEIAPLLMFLGLIAIVISYLALKTSQIKQVEKQNKKATVDIKSNKKALNLEEELNKLMASSESRVAKSKRLKEGTGSKLSYTDRIQDGIISTIRNPYNQISVVNMFFIVAIASMAGLITGVLLQNAAVAISGMILGVITPFSLINLRGLKKKMAMMKGNLTLLMNHYPNYIDSSTFEESLVRTIANIEQNTPQCKAFRICLKNMQDNNMPITNAINILRKQLMADKYVDYYLDGVLKAEMDDKQYKQVLNSIMTQFEYLVRKNEEVTGFAFVIYILYICGLIGMIAAIAILKSSDPEVYKLLASTLGGQAVTAVLFIIAGIVGFVLSSTSDLIRLDQGFDKAIDEEQ